MNFAPGLSQMLATRFLGLGSRFLQPSLQIQMVLLHTIDTHKGPIDTKLVILLSHHQKRKALITVPSKSPKTFERFGLISKCQSILWLVLKYSGTSRRCKIHELNIFRFLMLFMKRAQQKFCSNRKFLLTKVLVINESDPTDNHVEP